MPVLSNPRHETFAQELAKGTHANDAYVKAGYSKSSGNASVLKQSVGVQQRVEELRAKSVAKAEITIARVVQEYVHIATADVTQVVKWRKRKQRQKGKGESVVMLTDSDDLPPHVRAAIASVKQTKEGIVVTFHPKAPALDSLAKYLGMFKPDAAVNLNISLAEIVRESYAAKPAAGEGKAADGETGPETPK